MGLFFKNILTKAVLLLVLAFGYIPTIAAAIWNTTGNAVLSTANSSTGLSGTWNDGDSIIVHNGNNVTIDYSVIDLAIIGSITQSGPTSGNIYTTINNNIITFVGNITANNIITETLTATTFISDVTANTIIGNGRDGSEIHFGGDASGRLPQYNTPLASTIQANVSLVYDDAFVIFDSGALTTYTGNITNDTMIGHSGTINIGDANLPTTINFNGNIGAFGATLNSINLYVNGTLNLVKSGTSIYANTIDGDGTGTLNITSPLSFNAQIGTNTNSLVGFSITATGNVSLASSNIYANNFNHTNTNVIYQTDTIIHGNYNTNNATLSLGTNSLVVAAGNNVGLTGTLVVNATYDGSIGYVATDISNATLTHIALTSLTLKIINNGTVPAVGTEVDFIKTGIIDTPSITAFNHKIILDTSNNANWMISPTTAGALRFLGMIQYPSPIVPNPQPQSSLSNNTILSTLQNTDSFYSSIVQNIDSLPAQSQALLASIENNQNALSEFETLQTDQTRFSASTQAIGGIALDSTLNSVSDRMLTLPVFSSTTHPVTTEGASASREPLAPATQKTNSTHTATTAPLSADEENIGAGENLEASASGVAAGSAYDKYGVWVSFIGSKALQRSHKGVAGFKSNSTGGIIGIDSMINDQTIIGLAISDTFTKIKHNNAGNRTSAESWVGTIYGQYSFYNNWFVRATAATTHNKIKSVEKRLIGPTQYGAANAKYNMLSLGGDVSVGYNYKTKNNISITPSIGLRYSHANKIAYKETGNTGQNKSITQKQINTASGLVGMQISSIFNRNNINFVPEVHGNAQYGLNNKSPSGTFKNEFSNNGPATSFIGSKPSRLSGSIGVGVTASSDVVECGIGYDVSLADKYVGQQVSTTLKLKF